MNYYAEKESVYFSMPRYDLISLIPPGKNLKILELGAGGGDTLLQIKRANPNFEVHGIELFHIKDSHQNHPDIDSMLIGDIEKIDLDFSPKYIDILLIGDVLEHLIDPWAVLTKLKGVLKDSAKVIASIPNIRYYQSLKKIVFNGTFKYEKSGIFDKTHLRYFCKADMHDLFQSQGYKIEKIVPITDMTKIKSKGYYFNKFTFKVFEEFINLQYIVIAQV